MMIINKPLPHLPPIEKLKISTLFQVAFRYGLPAIILFVYLAGNLAQRHTGMGDNGDFTRIMGWFSSAPVGFTKNFSLGDYEYSIRYFHYWLPFWKLDYPMNYQLSSSALLLWAPGVWLNRLFYSTTTLYLFSMSLPARILGFVFLLLLILWLRRFAHAPILYITIVLPLALMLISTGYNAYFNTFYQETASLIFLLFLFAMLIYVRNRPFSIAACGMSFAALFLFSTAKVSNLYWPVLSLPFFIPPTKWIKKPLLYIGLAALWVIIPTYATYRYVAPYHLEKQNQFQSIFFGILLFSQNPEQRLTELGINDGMECLNVTAYGAEGIDCIHQHMDHLSYLTTFKILAHEPTILWTQFVYLSRRMQELNVSYLGHYSLDDHNAHPTQLLNIWQTIKSNLFPRGIWLLATLFGCLVIFLFGLRKQDMRAKLSAVGLIATLACVIDMFVEIYGDGIADIYKHLFLSNLLFDVLLIVALNVLLLTSLQAVSSYRTRRSIRKDIQANPSPISG